MIIIALGSVCGFHQPEPGVNFQSLLLMDSFKFGHLLGIPNSTSVAQPVGMILIFYLR